MEVANRLLGHQPNSRESDEAFDPEPRPSEEEPDKDYENNMVKIAVLVLTFNPISS